MKNRRKEVVGMYWDVQDGDENRLGSHESAVNIRMIDDLNRLMVAQLSSYQHIDCIVGVPRSGVLVASMLALHLNVPLLGLQDFLAGNWQQPYSRRKRKHHATLELAQAEAAVPNVLVVDDSIGSGATFTVIRNEIAACGVAAKANIEYLGAICAPQAVEHIDHFLELVPFPRVFEWNLLHHPHSQYYCVDFDGVLCDDPTAEDNDDDIRYVAFCEQAKPKVIPTFSLGAIVTARLEKYRPQTEVWLKRHNISYDRLIMCNLSSGAERRRLQAHATIKADVYNKLGGILFVESDIDQARSIFALTGKPAFCLGHGQIRKEDVANPLEAQARILRDTISRQAKVLDQLYQSTSWRITRPLRSASAAIRGLANRS